MNFKFSSVFNVAVGICCASAAADTGALRKNAEASCLAAKGGEPKVVTTVGDGLGGHLVWLTDAATDLFLCRSDSQARVSFYEPIFGDLLEGAGVGLFASVSVGRDGKQEQRDPAGIAAAACKVYLGDGAEVLSLAPDGLSGAWLSGYAVVLTTKADETFFCDATPNAQVWVLARIDNLPAGPAPVG